MIIFCTHCFWQINQHKEQQHHHHYQRVAAITRWPRCSIVHAYDDYVNAASSSTSKSMYGAAAYLLLTLLHHITADSSSMSLRHGVPLGFARIYHIVMSYQLQKQ